jgi:hypothetical protein
MLQHIECPRCRAPNTGAEYVCFACGAPLKAMPKRFGRQAAVSAPWPMWLGLLLVLGLAGYLGYRAIIMLAGYREVAGWPAWYLPGAGAALVIGGQLAFLIARRGDADWWRLRRAPQLPLSQAHTGDAVWTRGKVRSDSPIVPAYFPQECVYYHYVVRERESGEGGWRVTERETNAVDFELADGEEVVYVPSGSVHFDAPVYVESYLDPSGTAQVKLWAIPLGLPVSLCARIAGETARPRVDPLEEDLQGVVTWRSAQDYLAMVARRARMTYLGGWALTALGAVALIAGLAREAV